MDDDSESFESPRDRAFREAMEQGKAQHAARREAALSEVDAALDSRGKVDPTWAWTLALSPLLVAVVAYYATSLNDTAVLVVALVVNIGLAALDQKRCEAAGYNVGLLAAVILIPWYLIERTRVVKSTPAIPLAWFLSVGALLLVGGTFRASYDLDHARVERSVERWIKQQGMGAATVSCPADLDGKRKGDTFTCDVAQGSTRAHVVVAVVDGGGVTWQLAP